MISPILAIETSCDDTSVAIVDSDFNVLALSSRDQDELHSLYGGIVPEEAARSHLLRILPVLQQVLLLAGIQREQLKGIAVTARPGLVGSLLMGLVTAKSLAQFLDLPLLAVNHLEGHIYAPFLKDQEYLGPKLSYPFLALVISGGHSHFYRVRAFRSYFVLGKTMDDAAGEALDKFGKLLGIQFPGGPEVDKLSQGGDPTRFDFPRPMLDDLSLNFSFSGIKAAAVRMLANLSHSEIEQKKTDLCASFLQAITDVLVSKTRRAIIQEQAQGKLSGLVLSGGVSSNSMIRAEILKLGEELGLPVWIPPKRYCTDNAAMIGVVGQLCMRAGLISDMSLSPSALSLESDFNE